MKRTMTRSVNGRVRYYTFELFPTLFGESIVIRTYGSVQKSKPTGEIKEVYSNQVDAQHSVDVLIASKHKRGYRPKAHNH
jgi:predicted DNA-binding WGR domain protein